MNTTALPSIFAVYRPETNTFSIYQPEVVLNNIVHRLTPWHRPVKSCWSACSDTERVQIRRWFEGQRWYILPNQESRKDLYTVIIDKKLYTFWSLNHSLIWAKRFASIDDNCPSIPILEFNSQKLVSSMNPGLYAIWNTVQSKDLLEESAIGWGALFDRINSDSGSEKPLRIRTPVVKSSDSDSDKEKEEDTFAVPVEPQSWTETIKSWIGVGLYGCTAVTIVTIYTTIIRTLIGI